MFLFLCLQLRAGGLTESCANLGACTSSTAYIEEGVGNFDPEIIPRTILPSLSAGRALSLPVSAVLLSSHPHIIEDAELPIIQVRSAWDEHFQLGWPVRLGQLHSLRKRLQVGG